MQFFIVFVATSIALFWDETLITLIGLLTQKKLSATFMIYWMLFSGLLAGLLLAFHVPGEYRVITMIMMGTAVLFNLNSRKDKSSPIS